MHFIHGLPAFAIISKHLLKFIDRMRMHMDDAGYTRGVRPTAAALVIWKCLVIPYEKYVGMRFFDSIRRDGHPGQDALEHVRGKNTKRGVKLS